MNKFALKLLETRYMGPVDFIQLTASRNNNIGRFLESLSCLCVLDCDVPKLLIGIPHTLLNLVVSFDVS